jgi:hypothetical protein
MADWRWSTRGLPTHDISENQYIIDKCLRNL